jgi:putative transposase
MFLRSEVLQNGEFFHVFNRGVDKEVIFIDDNDRRRFVESLTRFKGSGVRILSFCLMDNHFHLLLEQLDDDGVSSFMHKLGIGYTMYFNKRHSRTDSLFGSRYQFTHISNEAHFLHISRYIHLNSVDLVIGKYKKLGIFDFENLAKYLRNFPWSSYPMFVGEQTDHDFIDPSPILKCFNGSQDYESFVLNWLFAQDPI